MRAFPGLALAPGVLIALAILAISDRIWAITTVSYTRNGTRVSTMGANTAWIVVLSVAIYFGGLWAGRRYDELTEQRLGAWLVRAVGVALLYGWLFKVVSTLRAAT